VVVGAQDLALVAEGLERFVELQMAHVAQGLHEEAAVQQVQDRVLRAAGV